MKKFISKRKKAIKNIKMSLTSACTEKDFLRVIAYELLILLKDYN